MKHQSSPMKNVSCLRFLTSPKVSGQGHAKGRECCCGSQWQDLMTRWVFFTAPMPTWNLSMPKNRNILLDMESDAARCSLLTQLQLAIPEDHFEGQATAS